MHITLTYVVISYFISNNNQLEARLWYLDAKVKKLVQDGGKQPLSVDVVV